jgi:hypothetical protein
MMGYHDSRIGPALLLLCAIVDRVRVGVVDKKKKKKKKDPQ